jgi:hypothetical protein
MKPTERHLEELVDEVRGAPPFIEKGQERVPVADATTREQL